MNKHYLMGSMALLMAGALHAQNPIVQTCYTYSTTDMVNWTDHGSPLAIETFSWADDRAWAAQCVEHNGKFYWYVCLHSKLSNAMAIGVAVGDSPTGPFKDAIGKPLHDGSWDYIDPTVLIDDDGAAYLYFNGNHGSVYATALTEDYLDITGPVTEQYAGLHPLHDGERWGYPFNRDEYPLAAFHFAGDADSAAFTLCFEDRDGAEGLHTRYDALTGGPVHCIGVPGVVRHVGKVAALSGGPALHGVEDLSHHAQHLL